MNVATKQMFELEIYDHDPDLAHAFRIAGRRSLSEADLAAIDAHSFTLYVITSGGSTNGARNVMQAVSGLLRAGGLAVKVESAGVAHSRADWLSLLADDRDLALYHAFVTLIGREDKTYYSCGMHNLGYPDAVVSAAIDPDTAAHLLNQFLMYTLVEHPVLEEGHTFSIGADSPFYRLTHEAQTRYPQTSPFHNPFGLWRLVPLSRTKL